VCSWLDRTPTCTQDFVGHLGSFPRSTRERPPLLVGFNGSWQLYAQSVILRVRTPFYMRKICSGNSRPHVDNHYNLRRPPCGLLSRRDQRDAGIRSWVHLSKQRLVATVLCRLSGSARDSPQHVLRQCPPPTSMVVGTRQVTSYFIPKQGSTCGPPPAIRIASRSH